MILNPDILKYLDDLQPKSGPLLEKLERLAKERDFPIIGPQVGRFLATLVRFSGASRVLELGSGFGYSALWIASVLPEGGQVHLTEFDPGQLGQARDNLERAGLVNRARFHEGDALSLAADLPGKFDLVFNDVDKEYYPAVVDLAIEKLRPGGLLVTDNALWYGKPADPSVDSTLR